MPFDLNTFKAAYEKWVAESLPDFRAHKMDAIVKKYPFVISDDVPWAPYSGKPSEQTFAWLPAAAFTSRTASPLLIPNRSTEIPPIAKSPGPFGRKTFAFPTPIMTIAWRNRTLTPSSPFSG